MTISRRFFLGLLGGAIGASASRSLPITLPTTVPPPLVPLPVSPLGPSIMDLIAAQACKVEHKLPKIFEESDQIALMIRRTHRIPVSSTNYRIPLQQFNQEVVNAKHAGSFGYQKDNSQAQRRTHAYGRHGTARRS